MILVKPSFEIHEQEPGMEGMLKQIEYCGRISHKSEDKITENSYVDFIKKMEKLHHYATFEHGTVYLKFIDEDYTPYKTKLKEALDFYEKNPYSKIKYHDCGYYVTTNYRVICENNRKEDLANWCEPTEWHEKRHTVVFICDLGVSREFNRHRVDSILEESTRYCDYTKDKFNNELNIMIPIWLESRINEMERLMNKHFIDFCEYLVRYGDEDFGDIDYWLMANLCSEYCYEKLIKNFKWTPQQARTVLPLDLKTTLAHTAFDSDWQHFFSLRSIGSTGAPHPSAKELAEPLMENFLENNYI